MHVLRILDSSFLNYFSNQKMESPCKYYTMNMVRSTNLILIIFVTRLIRSWVAIGLQQYWCICPMLKGVGKQCSQTQGYTISNDFNSCAFGCFILLVLSQTNCRVHVFYRHICLSQRMIACLTVLRMAMQVWFSRCSLATLFKFIMFYVIYSDSLQYFIGGTSGVTWRYHTSQM